MVGGPRGQNSRPRETGRGADEKGQRMERPSWAPEGIDIERPSQARVYDYFLGGSHNFAVDRAAAQQGIAVMPDIAVQAQANRAGSAPGRTVSHRCWDQAVPGHWFWHSDPGRRRRDRCPRTPPARPARVVYVDIDPVAVAHSRQMLADNDAAVVFQEDLRRPEAILNHPQLRALLDFDQPIALLMLAILHVVPDDAEPANMWRDWAMSSPAAATWRSPMPPTRAGPMCGSI